MAINLSDQSMSFVVPHPQKANVKATSTARGFINWKAARDDGRPTGHTLPALSKGINDYEYDTSPKGAIGKILDLNTRNNNQHMLDCFDMVGKDLPNGTIFFRGVFIDYTDLDENGCPKEKPIVGEYRLNSESSSVKW